MEKIVAVNLTTTPPFTDRIDASVTMKITGHSTMSMYDRYNTVDDDDTRKAVAQMEGYLKSVDQNVDQDIKKEVNNSLLTP